MGTPCVVLCPVCPSPGFAGTSCSFFLYRANTFFQWFFSFVKKPAKAAQGHIFERLPQKQLKGTRGQDQDIVGARCVCGSAGEPPYEQAWLPQGTDAAWRWRLGQLCFCGFAGEPPYGKAWLLQGTDATRRWRMERWQRQHKRAGVWQIFWVFAILFPSTAWVRVLLSKVSRVCVQMVAHRYTHIGFCSTFPQCPLGAGPAF